MDAEEREESAQYPYLGSPLSKEAESITPDLLERDYTANTAIQDIPLPQEPSTPHRYIEDPTCALMDDETPETKSYGFPSPSGVVPEYVNQPENSLPLSKSLWPPGSTLEKPKGHLGKNGIIKEPKNAFPGSYTNVVENPEYLTPRSLPVAGPLPQAFDNLYYWNQDTSKSNPGEFFAPPAAPAAAINGFTTTPTAENLEYLGLAESVTRSKDLSA